MTAAVAVGILSFQTVRGRQVGMTVCQTTKTCSMPEKLIYTFITAFTKVANCHV